jgi:subtilisin family serine protease
MKESAMIRNAVCSLLVGLLTLTGSLGARELDSEERARVDPRTLAQWDRGEQTMDVIVHLHAPPEARLALSPRGMEQPEARLAAVAETTRRVLGELVTKVASSDIVTDHVSPLRPEFSATVSRDGLLALLDRAGVRYIEHDQVWQVKTRQGIGLINADAVHDLGITGAGTSIAIVDTGVDYNHRTLGNGPIPNGTVVYGLDTADGSSDPMDCGTHGTAVASVAAGSGLIVGNYGGGVARGAQILAYKATRTDDCGSFSSSNVVEAIDDAVLQRDRFNVVAINLSIGGQRVEGPCDSRNVSYTQAINDATEAGIAVVAASGNEGEKDRIASPGCSSNAISVASVYDDPSATERGISYCGDEDCSTVLCTDQGLPAAAVTCYSNVNAFLDVFAPSESLLVADAGAGFTSFGGTSGAAPYVAGAIALLHEAMPGLDPTQIRMLLAVTGAPVTDPANQVTRPLIDVAAALAGRGVGLGSANRLQIPNGGGLSARSTAVVEDDGPVAAVRVSVKIVHGEPQQLVVTLVSPAGTRVVLHDHAPGMTSEPNGVLRVDSLFATYPDDRPTAEPLDVLVGEDAAGTWTLEVLDDDPANAPGPPQTLVGWAVEVTTVAQAEPTSFVPVGVHASGANQTFWITDARVLNPGPQASAAVGLHFVPADADGTSEAIPAEVSVPAGAILDLPDLVLETFGLDGFQGNILVESTEDLVITSRTYNTGGGSGTYGQFIGEALPSDSIGQGDEPALLLQLASTDDFRTNIGLSETSGQPASVTITLRAGDTGAVLASSGPVAVASYSNTQVNRVFDELGAPPSGNAYAAVSVTSGSGRVLAYASVVDNQTGDAIFIPGLRPVSAESLVVPIVAKAAGVEGTTWVSDVRVLNSGSGPVTLDLELRPELGSQGQLSVSSVTVAAGQVLAMNDVVGTIFGWPDGQGSLRLAPRGGPAQLLATSRTYNQTGAGTFGQFIGAVSSGTTGPSTVIHLDKNSAFRSNVGFCEVGGGSLELALTLRDAAGGAIGQGAVSLGPFQVDQINDVFAALGAQPTDNARLDIAVVSGDGAYTAYASVVDNLSGDAIAIPSEGLAAK